MPFTINCDVCVACGSCIGNCPNRAIVRRGTRVCITDMCWDCGVCLRYCPVSAIGPGPSPAVLDSRTLDRSLQDKLGLTRTIAAMKLLDTFPADIPVEPGPHFWCGMCGDVFDGDAGPRVFTAAASTCGGCANIGLGTVKAGRDDFIAAMEASTVGPGRLFATKEAMTANRDRFPQFRRVAGGMLIGPFSAIPRPDLIIFPLNPGRLCVLATAFAYETGEVISGFAGKSTCLMTVAAPLEHNRPVFAAGDHGGRMFMRLADDELLVCLPFSLVPGLVRNLDKTVFASLPGD